MARMLNGILGEARNKVGNIVCASWRGINYARQYTIPSNPKTVDQEAWRAEFKRLILCISSVLTPITHKFWEPLARGMSGFNLQVMKSVPAFKPGKELKALCMSYGGLEPNTISTAAYGIETGSVIINFASACMGNGLATDFVVGVVYDETSNIAFVSDLETGRDAGTLEVPIGVGRAAHTMVAWTFCYRGDSMPYLVSTSTGADVSVS
jgi:hypothetical protein